MYMGVVLSLFLNIMTASLYLICSHTHSQWRSAMYPEIWLYLDSLQTTLQAMLWMHWNFIQLIFC